MFDIENIFRCRGFDRQKLADFGFTEKDGVWSETFPLSEHGFAVDIVIKNENEVSAEVRDTETGDVYVQAQMPSAEGAFVGKIRAGVKDILSEIAQNCTYSEVFKTAYAGNIIRYVKEKYAGDFEFLWEKFPRNAVVRRQDNQKWYAALLTVQAEKIGRGGKEIIEIIDLRCPPDELEKLVDGKNYFPGWHMNKKYWLTMCLDGSVPFEEICRRIDASYVLAGK